MRDLLVEKDARTTGNAYQFLSRSCLWQFADRFSGVTVLFPASGNRNTDGSLNNFGTNGYAWSSSPNNANAYNLNFNSGAVNPANNTNRLIGFPVRCVVAFIILRTSKDYIGYERTLSIGRSLPCLL